MGGDDARRMRTLDPAPSSLFDPLTSLPRVGSYEGPLPRIDYAPLGRGPLHRLLHQKRWIYAAIATDAVYFGAAIVDLGYASSAFAFALDARERRLLLDRSVMGHPLSARVGAMTGEGCLAYFQLGKTLLRFNRSFDMSHYSLHAEGRGFCLDARLETAKAPPPISVIAPIEGGVLSSTEKRALLGVTGEATFGGKKLLLDGALGGFDYTNGYLARHTVWRWAYALGRAVSGERVAMNLVQGFVGEPECAVWVDDRVYPVGEGRFTFDAARPESPWLVATDDGAVDLRFEPLGIHAEKKSYGVVASQFIQPAGLYRGTIRLPGRPALELDRVLGVTEDQDVLW
jgi:hypothetical protein